MKNETEIMFDAFPENVDYVIATITAFVSIVEPSDIDIEAIEIAVTEAVKNAIVHGYGNVENDSEIYNPGKVRVCCVLEDDSLYIEVVDNGKGIDNMDKALESLYTSQSEQQHLGRGFVSMENYMDTLWVKSEPGVGTTVQMTRRLM